MPDRKLPFVNVAMWGGGYYSTATKGAKNVIDGATPLVLDSIRRMPETGATDPFTLADMGCADGGTSIDLVRCDNRGAGPLGGNARSRWFIPTSRAMITIAYSISFMG